MIDVVSLLIAKTVIVIGGTYALDDEPEVGLSVLIPPGPIPNPTWVNKTQRPALALSCTERLLGWDGVFVPPKKALTNTLDEIFAGVMLAYRVKPPMALFTFEKAFEVTLP